MNTKLRKPQALIAVHTHQRSGSKWVGSLIRKRYAAISLGEIFNPEDKSMLSLRSYLSQHPVNDLTRSSISSMLDRYFDGIRTYLGLFYTFDVMFNQLDWLNFGLSDTSSVLHEYLKSNNDIVVSLIRDPRDIYVSMKALEITNKAHFTEMEMNEPFPKIHLDCKRELCYNDYIFFKNKLSANRLVLSKAFSGYDNYIELHYEDLVQNPSMALEPLDHALRRFGDSIGHSLSNNISPFPSLIRTPVKYHDLFDNINDMASWPS